MTRRSAGSGAPGALRVLLLNWRDSGHPEGGGAETFLERMATGLRRHGHDVTVRVAAYPGAEREETVDGVRYLRRGGRFTVYARSAVHLARHGRDVDVVVDVQNGMPFWTPLFTRRPVVNVTHHLHREQWQVVFGRTAGRLGWWLESWVAPRVYRRCRYLTVSGATREDLVRLGVSPERVGVVYSGIDAPVVPVDADAWPRSPEPSLVVLGRTVPHKRVELALATLAELRRELPTASLTVIGHGYHEAALRAEAQRLGVAGAVDFRGWVDDVTKHRLLARAWVHVMPSVKEGWGLAVVESAAHGTPTVAFRSAGGTGESVRDGETGLLVNDETGFTVAVRRLLTDAELREHLGHGARVHATKYTWAAAVDQFEAELRAVAGLPRRRMAPGPDLVGRADLGRADLGRADLGRADLGRADLGRADLGRADLEIGLGAGVDLMDVDAPEGGEVRPPAAAAGQ